MSENALERLFNGANSPPKEYSLEEQLEDVYQDENDFLLGMSEKSKAELLNRTGQPPQEEEQDDTLDQAYSAADENQQEDEYELNELQKSAEVHEEKRKRGRPPKVQKDDVSGEEVNQTSTGLLEENEIFKKLAQDIIQDLIDNKYIIYKFKTEQMLLILNYMKSKF